jgi:flagellar motor switch protein FliM
MKGDILPRALSQSEIDDITINVDNAERRVEASELGEVSPSYDADRERMLKRALILIGEFKKMERFFREELETISGCKPERKRRDRKQERKDMYERYFVRKGYN